MRYVPDTLTSLYDRSPVWSRSLFSTAYGWVKSHKETGPLFRRFYAELERSQWSDAAALEESQLEKLRKLLAHAERQVPYYARLFADHGIRVGQIQTLDDLKTIPVLTKETVRTSGHDLLAKNYAKARLLHETTSGTTGTPLNVWMDHPGYLRVKAAQWLHHGWAGYHHDEWVGVLAGYRVVSPRRKSPPFWVTNYYGRQIHFSTLHLGPSTLSAYARRIRGAGVKYLIGYPSAIGLLAGYLAGRGEQIPLKAVFLSSEPIYLWQEQVIREAFACPIFDYYSQSEKAVSAMSCGHSANLHVSMENCIAELVPAPGRGDRKLLVGTSLTNFAMPLIRYAVHDVSGVADGACPCGRASRMIRRIETQEDSFIVHSDGSLMSPGLLYTPIHNLTGIVESQIIQDRLGHLLVRVVSDGSFGPDQRETLSRSLEELFQGEVQVSIEDVDQIPRTQSGKFRFIVSHCSHEMAAGRPE